MDSLTYMYENVIESYVEDIYTGVIEDYTIATVKVITQFSVAKATLESQMSVRLSVRPSVCPSVTETPNQL